MWRRGEKGGELVRRGYKIKRKERKEEMNTWDDDLRWEMEGKWDKQFTVEEEKKEILERKEEGKLIDGEQGEKKDESSRTN